MGYSLSDPFRDMREIWRWDLLLGGGGVAFAVASAGQAVRGNGADEWIFSACAVGLLASATPLLLRASRFVNPLSLSLVVAMCAMGGVDSWHLRWWAACPAWLVIAVALHFLARRRYEALRRRGVEVPDLPPSARRNVMAAPGSGRG